jgi:hypothetical protein
VTKGRGSDAETILRRLNIIRVFSIVLVFIMYVLHSYRL